MAKMMNEHEAIKFLLDKGLLFEINRMILHPFGFALAVRMDEKGECKFDGLWDSREDSPEGTIFEDEVLEEGEKKYRSYLSEEGFDRKNTRYEKLGFVYQDKHDREVIVKKAQEMREKLFGADPEKAEKPQEEEPQKEE